MDDNLSNQILCGTSTAHQLVMQIEIADTTEDIPRSFDFIEEDSVGVDMELRRFNVRDLVPGQAGMYLPREAHSGVGYRGERPTDDLT